MISKYDRVDLESSASARLRVFKYLALNISKDLRIVVLGLFLASLYGAGKAVQNLIPKWLIDSLDNGYKLVDMWYEQIASLICLYLICSVILRMLCFHFAHRIFSRFREGIIGDLRGKIMRYSLEVPFGQLSSFNPGAISSLMFGVPIQNIGLFLRQITLVAPGALVTVVVTLYFFQTWDWLITYTLLFTCCVAVALMKRSASRSTALGSQYQREEAKLGSTINDYLFGLSTIKSQRIESHVYESVYPRFIGLGSNSTRRDVDLHKEWMKQELVSYLCYATLMGVCAYRFYTSEIGLGVVAASLAAFIALQTPLEALFQTVILGGSAYPSMAKILSLSNHSNVPASTAKGDPSPELDIVFDNVRFSHQGNDIETVKGIDVRFRRGEKIAVVGRSGAGKSTLVELLMGLLKPSNGNILIGGVAVTDVPAHSVKDIVSIVPQTPFVFSASLRENLCLGRQDFTDDSIIMALRTCGLSGLLESLPQGLETAIGTDGRMLSGGEKQRIAIARALLVNPDIVIFDEATSALDLITQREVIEGLFNVFSEKTVIMVTHRMEALQFCNRVVVIEDGAIAQDGEPCRLSIVPGPLKEMLHQPGTAPELI